MKKGWPGRIAKIALIGGVLLGVLGAVLVTQLGSAPVRSLVRGQVKSLVGLDVDYTDLAIGLDGLVLTGPALLPPTEDAALVPQVLQAEQIAVGWDARALLSGQVALTEVRIDKPRLRAVVDADGSSTLSRIAALLPKQEAPKEATPVSSSLAALQTGKRLSVQRLLMQGGGLVVHLRGPSGRARRIEVSGLDARLSGHWGDQPAALDATLWLNDSAKVAMSADPSLQLPASTPAAVEIARYLRAGHKTRARGRLRLHVIDGDTVKVEGWCGPRQPWKLAGRRVERLAEAKVSVKFSPEKRRARMALTGGRVLGDLAESSFIATLNDRPQGAVTVDVNEARVQADLAPFVPLIPPVLGKLDVKSLRGGLLVRNVTGIGSGQMPRVQEVDVHAIVQRASYQRGEVKAAIGAAELQMAAFPGRDGSVSLQIDAPLEAVRWSDKRGGAQAAMGRAKMRVEVESLRVDPVDTLAATASVRATGTIDRIDAALPAMAATITGARPELVVHLGQRRANVEASAQLERFDAVAVPWEATVTATDLQLHSTVTELPLDIAHGLGESQITTAATAGELLALVAGQRAELGQPSAEVTLAGIALPPFSPVAAIGTASLRMSAQRAIASSFGALSELAAEVSGRVLKVDPAAPQDATGELTMRANVGKATMQAKLERHDKPVRWQAAAHVPRLGKLIGGLKLPRKLRRAADWDRLSLDLKSDGTARGVGGRGPVRLEHRETITAGGLVAQLGGFRTSVPLATLQLNGQGAGSKHELQMAADLTSLALASYRGGGKHQLKGRLLVDLRRPELSFDAGMQAVDGPQLHAKGHAFFEKAGRLKWSLDGKAARLASIAAALPASLRKQLCVDLRRISAEGTASGWVAVQRKALLSGAAARAWRRGKLPDAVLTASFEAERLRCKTAKLYADVPKVGGSLRARLQDRVATADGKLNLAALRFEAGGIHGAAKGIQHSFTVRTERLARAHGKTTLTASGKLAELAQSAVPKYPIGDSSFELAITHINGADVSIDRFELHNRLAGSSLQLEGGAQLQVDGRAGAALGSDGLATRVSGRKALWMTGRFDQDLGKLVAREDRFVASGSISVPFSLESGDLAVIRIAARARFDHVSAGVPDLQLEVRDVHGSVPMLEDFYIADGKVKLLGGGANNAYARWRFSDQHPFLGGDHFVSIQQARFRDWTMGPVAANVAVDRNVMHLDQLEMDVAGGKVAGNCIVHIDGSDTELLFRGNVTGLRAGDGDDRLDANAALDIKPAQLSIGGRAEVLRLAPAHLKAMLDLWDPYGEDDRANKLRLALKAGYPKRMRMLFSHGFADFRVELGGLGSVVRIDDVRGVPIGPAMARFAAPFIRRSLRLLEVVQ